MYKNNPKISVKPIEYAARFEGNAFIVFSMNEFPHLTSEKHEVIELELRTNAQYGVILWQGQNPDSSSAGEDYVSLGLNDGYLGRKSIYLLILTRVPHKNGVENYERKKLGKTFHSYIFTLFFAGFAVL
jgi:hypothetical protein